MLNIIVKRLIIGVREYESQEFIQYGKTNEIKSTMESKLLNLNKFCDGNMKDL